jgi:hypothetical protein
MDADDRVVVLTHADGAAEADAIVAVLTAHGVPAYAAYRRLEDVFPTLFSSEGTAVMVRAADLDEARTILASTPDD